MVVGITFQQHLLPIQFQSEVRPESDGADAEVIAGLIGHRTVLTQQLGFDSI